MSSLAQRLGRAVESPESPASRVLFPLDTVRDYLDDHPLVVHLDLESNVVHRAILDFDRMVSSHAAAVEGARTSSSGACAPPGVSFPRRSPPKCHECARGPIEADWHNGCLTCNHCGLVVWDRLNFEPSYEDLPPRKAPGKVEGVSSRMMRRPEEDGDPEMRRQLRHWNEFTNLPEDEITMAWSHLRGWSTSAYSQSYKVAAVLLHHRLKTHFPSEEEVRQLVSRRRSLPEVVRTIPEPEFACAKCGRKCYSVKDARYHCGHWPSAKRKKR